jgi:SAM-dependent methyltransferase
MARSMTSATSVSEVLSHGRLIQSGDIVTCEQLKQRPHASLINYNLLVSLLQQDRDLFAFSDSFSSSHYFRVASMQAGESINSSSDDLHYKRHLWRMSDFVSGASGLTLDVGCGDPLVGMTIFPPACSYVGVDPFPSAVTEMAHRAAGEDLPFRDDVFDVVSFNTSLDHILDYVTALLEARRVLRRGGTLFVSSLIWSHSHSLIPDRVHFHHFKDFEIFGAVSHCGFRVAETKWYSYKSDTHRFGLYLACKAI